MPELPPPADIARTLPDEARWVDLRGMLLSGRCAVYAGADPAEGFVARSWDFPFAAVAGRPSAPTLRRAVEDADATGTTGTTGTTDTAGAGETSSGEWHLLVQEDAAAHVAEALPGWRQRGVTLHRFHRELPRSRERPPEGAEVRLAPRGAAAEKLAGRMDLAHLPAALRDELSLDFVAERPMAAAFVDGRPVAFCYAPYVTEGLWDVAVDTLSGHRRRGLAAACFEALAFHMAQEGRRPVWGAMDDNLPSMRLAARLGFVPEAKLVSFLHPGAGAMPGTDPQARPDGSPVG